MVLIPRAQVTAPAGIVVMDVVLCPQGLGSYVTRLLLERRIEQKPTLNWQTASALGRTWQTWSWNHISPNQPWIQIYAEHLRLLR